MSHYKTPISLLQSMLSENRTYITYLEFCIKELKGQKFEADKQGQIACEHMLHNQLQAQKKELAKLVSMQKFLKKLVGEYK